MRIKRVKFIIIISLFIVGFSSLFITAGAFTSGQEYEVIKNLEDMNIEKPASEETETITRPNVEYKAGNFRDPFQIEIEEESAEPGKIEEISEETYALSPLTVQGIIWGGRFPQAIVNNKVLKIGDTIEGALVIDIKKDEITLLYKGKQYKLSSTRAGAVPSKEP